MKLRHVMQLHVFYKCMNFYQGHSRSRSLDTMPKYCNFSQIGQPWWKWDVSRSSAVQNRHDTILHILVSLLVDKVKVTAVINKREFLKLQFLPEWPTIFTNHLVPRISTFLGISKKFCIFQIFSRSNVKVIVKHQHWNFWKIISP